MGRRPKALSHRAVNAALGRAAKLASSRIPDQEPEPTENVTAHAAKLTLPPFEEESLDSELHLGSVPMPDGNGECSWNGDVNYVASDSDGDWKSTANEEDSDSGLSELEGTDLINSLQKQLELEVAALSAPTPYEKINQPISSKDWAKAEANRALGCSGLSKRTLRRKAKDKRDGAIEREQTLNS
ncbi:hypothetical protein C8J57DRAFT_1257387 [Mycena rebaudengoi]|nr:hypothetical protein C8J57DRAFT_1257387 [Mycena rebaudengoi]